MKKILLFLLCLSICFSAFAQTPIPVTNFSFEEPDTATFTVAASPPDYGADIVTGYAFSGWTITDYSSKYVGLMDNAYVPAEISTPYGNQMAYCDNSAQFTSEVVTTTQENTTYTLTVAFGNRDYDARSAGNYTIELLVDGLPVTSAFLDGQTIPRAGWQDLSAVYGSVTEGGEITIRITHTEPGPEFRQGIWDNVRLDAKRALALNPDPADGAEFVDVNADLSWILVEGATCDVYFGTDPNLPAEDQVIFNEVVETYDPGTMEYETTYYWRVDGIEPNDLGGYTIHEGDTWSFTTEPEYPVINSISPRYLLAAAGDIVQFIIDAWDPLDGTLAYAWYKQGDDVTVYSTTNTLSISNVQLPDEGIYYCVLSNASPYTITSETVNLTIKQLIGWWAFADPNDLSGYGNDAVVSGPVPAEGDTALQFDGVDDTVSIPVSVFDRLVPTQISIALWQYGYGNAYSNNRIFEAEPTWLGVHMPWDGYIYWDASNRIYKAADLYDYTSQWNHWVFTKNTDENNMKIYLNGALWHSGPGSSLIGDIEAFGIGSSADATWGFYSGMIKDFRIYNYEISESEVAQAYYDTSGIPTCVDPSDYDLDGDCLVNLSDMAIVAADYLRCGLYPTTECP